MKKYRLAFDPWGLLLFLLMMLPCFVWFNLPAPNDILRGESATPVLDGIASVCQVLFVAALCLVMRSGRERLRFTPLIRGCIVCMLLYYLGWVLYYGGSIRPAVILLLTVPPCLSFLFYGLNRKNYIAVVLIVIFTACHLLYGMINFIMCGGFLWNS